MGSPLFNAKAYGEPSAFQPEKLLRESRRQKDLPDLSVPDLCLLDPDGDIVRYLAATGLGDRHRGWACYHTDMWTTEMDGQAIGVVGMAVGAPFAVLVAEQLAASGAELVISITSAGQLTELGAPPYFVLIDAALRDEGTSHHYQAPARWAHAPAHLLGPLRAAVPSFAEVLVRGPSWTTDAPYRETAQAIDEAQRAGAVCVEMEAAALYAYAAATGNDVICLAHVTNVIAAADPDFGKGEANGALASLALAAGVAAALTHSRA